MGNKEKIHRCGRKSAKTFHRHWHFFQLFALVALLFTKRWRLRTKSCSYHLVFTKSSSSVQTLWHSISFSVQFTWKGAARSGCRDCKVSLKYLKFHITCPSTKTPTGESIGCACECVGVCTYDVFAFTGVCFTVVFWRWNEELLLLLMMIESVSLVNTDGQMDSGVLWYWRWKRSGTLLQHKQYFMWNNTST